MVGAVVASGGMDEDSSGSSASFAAAAVLRFFAAAVGLGAGVLRFLDVVVVFLAAVGFLALGCLLVVGAFVSVVSGGSMVVSSSGAAVVVSSGGAVVVSSGAGGWSEEPGMSAGAEGGS